MAADLALVGVGMTRFTRQGHRGPRDLVEEAVRAAMTDARLAPADIQASFVGTVNGGPGIGARVVKNLGLVGRPIVNVENACATGSTALVEAEAWIRAGFCDVAIAVGVEILSGIRGPLIPQLASDPSWVFDTGLNLPGWYALRASQHMADYGLTREQMAAVVVKNRAFASVNPYAHFRTPVTTAEVLASPVVSDPLTLFECCPKVDGASAVIVCSGDFARARGLRSVWVRGMGMTSGGPVFTDDPQPGAAVRAALVAYEQAGVEPADLDVVECHDAFSIGEILYTEALGLCARGEGGRHVASGASSNGGRGAVVNPSGGLLGRGHPLGASGLAQVAEVVWQLRGDAGARQVDRAGLGVVHTMGASEFELDANVCVVHVLAAA